MDNLETQRTCLRRLRPNDLSHMIELETDPEVMKFTPSRFPLSINRIEQRLRNTIDKQTALNPLGFWVAEEKESGRFIGWFMLTIRRHELPELGFMITRRLWNQGYTTEITQRLVNFGLYELGYEGLVAFTDNNNFVSKKVLDKLGFRYTEYSKYFDENLQLEVQLDHYEIRKIDS